MARILILCLMLAEFSIFTAKVHGSEGLDLMAPMAVELEDVAAAPSPAPSSGGDYSGIGSGAPGNRRVTRHHSSDKSVAGGEVILGGFATALVAAIFCYIRVTRRNQHNKSAT